MKVGPSRGIVAVVVGLLLLAGPLWTLAGAQGGSDTETIMGYVYDEHGTPKAGVTVHCSLPDAYVVTDEDGAYLFRGTDLDGAGWLVFTATGYLKVISEFVLSDGDSLFTSIYLVETESETVGVAEVTGYVRDIEGEAMEGALVTLEAGGSELSRTLTDDEGRYTFADVPTDAGTYSLVAEGWGYLMVREAIEVAPGKTTWHDLTLRPDTPYEVIRGFVRDTRGLPLPGALVSISGASGLGSTDLAGYFRIQGEDLEGKRWVIASLQGYQENRIPIEVPDEEVVWANLTLTTTSGGGTETLWVRVTEVFSGEAIADAIVTIEGMDETWTTDSRGLVLIIDPEMEGVQRVTAYRDGYTLVSAEIVLEDGGTASLEIPLVQASNAVGLTGHVSDSATGLPVVGARVEVQASGISMCTITDEAGDYQLFKLPPGVKTTVSVSATSYEDAEATVTLAQYTLNSLDIALEPELKKLIDLRGMVTDGSDGSPVEGAQVTVWSGDFRTIARTDDDGGFSAGGIRMTGDLAHYFIEHQHYSALSGDIMPSPDGLVVIDAQLTPITPPLTVIMGYVRDPDGFVVEDATVGLSFAERTWETLAMDGMYQLFLSIDSEFTGEICAKAHGYGWHNQTPTVQAHVVNWVNFTVPLGPDFGNILGRVRTETGRDLLGAEVHLTMPGIHHQQVLTGPGGEFAFTRVPAMDARYELSAVAGGYSGTTVLALARGGSTTFYNLTVTEDVPQIETLRGWVVNAEGQPIVGAVVEVNGFDPRVTGNDGGFFLADLYLDGPRTLTATKPGFDTTTETFYIGLGQTVWVDITLEVRELSAAMVRGSVLSASDGRGLEGARVRLRWTESTDWTFEATTDAEGTFAIKGVPAVWDRVTVSAVSSDHYQDTAVLKVVEGQTTEVTFSLQRVELSVPAEGGAKEVVKVAISLGAIVAVIAAIAATEVGRVALIGLILLPLYTKIKREKVMDHFIRGRIYEYISQNPGVNYSAIKERFSLTNGTVTYHLSMLERQEFIRSKQDGIYKRYFRNGSGLRLADVQPMSVQLSIAKVIRERPGLTQKEIAKRVGSSKQLVSYHIRRMREGDLLETRREGRSVRVYPTRETPR